MLLRPFALVRTATRRSTILAVVLCAAAFSGCGTDRGGSPLGPAPVDNDVFRVTASVQVDTLSSGLLGTYSATAWTRQGQQVPGTAFSWKSLSPGLISLLSAGSVQALRDTGTARLEVSSYPQGADTILITLRPDPGLAWVRLQITPRVDTLRWGFSRVLSALIVQQNGAVLSSPATAWTVTPSVLVDVQANGVLTARADTGTITIVGRAGTLADTVRWVLVASNPSMPVAVALSRSVDTLGAGQQRSLTATVTRADGQVEPTPGILWTSSNLALASVTAQGLVTAFADTGMVSIVALSGRAVDTTVVLLRPSQPARWTFTWPTDTLPIGVARIIQTQALATNGLSMPVAGVLWASSNPAVATVDAAGTVRSVAAGRSVVRGTWKGRMDSVTVIVPPGSTGPSGVPPVVAVASVTIAPTSLSLVVGQTQVLTATTKDVAGAVLGNRPTSWVSSNPSIVSVSSLGVVAASAAGTVTITAVSEGKSGTATVTATAAPTLPVATVTVSPNALSLTIGQTQQLTALLRDGAGVILSNRVVSWTSATPSVATVSSTGVVTAVAAGTAIVTATSEGRAGTTTIAVSNATASTLRVSPRRVTIVLGESWPLAARTVSAAGEVSWAPATSWTVSSDGHLASPQVTGAGMATVRAVSPGTSVVRVTSGAMTDSVLVTVTNVPVTGLLPLPTQTLTANFPPALLALLETAANRWARLIRAPLASQSFTLPAGTCSSQMPTISFTTTGILILVEIDALDGPGGILASAGPCTLRANGMPLVGVVTIDAADVAQILATPGASLDLLTHEMGHVLGIGTLWYTSNLTQGIGTSSSRFIGLAGSQAYADLGFGTLRSATPVPLETAGSGYTHDAHWSEAMFGRELMTGWISLGAQNSLSDLSAAALGDLGYAIAPGRAEPYLVTSPTVSNGAALREPELILRETIRRPRFDADGRPLGGNR